MSQQIEGERKSTVAENVASTLNKKVHAHTENHIAVLSTVELQDDLVAVAFSRNKHIYVAVFDERGTKSLECTKLRTGPNGVALFPRIDASGVDSWIAWRADEHGDSFLEWPSLRRRDAECLSEPTFHSKSAPAPPALCVALFDCAARDARTLAGMSSAEAMRLATLVGANHSSSVFVVDENALIVDESKFFLSAQGRLTCCENRNVPVDAVVSFRARTRPRLGLSAPGFDVSVRILAWHEDGVELETNLLHCNVPLTLHNGASFVLDRSLWRGASVAQTLLCRPHGTELRGSQLSSSDVLSRTIASMGPLVMCDTSEHKYTLDDFRAMFARISSWPATRFAWALAADQTAGLIPLFGKGSGAWTVARSDSASAATLIADGEVAPRILVDPLSRVWSVCESGQLVEADFGNMKIDENPQLRGPLRLYWDLKAAEEVCFAHRSISGVSSELGDGCNDLVAKLDVIVDRVVCAGLARLLTRAGPGADWINVLAQLHRWMMAAAFREELTLGLVDGPASPRPSDKILAAYGRPRAVCSPCGQLARHVVGLLVDVSLPREQQGRAGVLVAAASQRLQVLHFALRTLLLLAREETTARITIARERLLLGALRDSSAVAKKPNLSAEAMRIEADADAFVEHAQAAIRFTVHQARLCRKLADAYETKRGWMSQIIGEECSRVLKRMVEVLDQALIGTVAVVIVNSAASSCGDEASREQMQDIARRADGDDDVQTPNPENSLCEEHRVLAKLADDIKTRACDWESVCAALRMWTRAGSERAACLERVQGLASLVTDLAVFFPMRWASCVLGASTPFASAEARKTRTRHSVQQKDGTSSAAEHLRSKQGLAAPATGDAGKAQAVCWALAICDEAWVCDSVAHALTRVNIAARNSTAASSAEEETRAFLQHVDKAPWTARGMTHSSTQTSSVQQTLAARLLDGLTAARFASETMTWPAWIAPTMDHVPKCTTLRPWLDMWRNRTRSVGKHSKNVCLSTLATYLASKRDAWLDVSTIAHSFVANKKDRDHDTAFFSGGTPAVHRMQRRLLALVMQRRGLDAHALGLDPLDKFRVERQMPRILTKLSDEELLRIAVSWSVYADSLGRMSSEVHAATPPTRHFAVPHFSDHHVIGILVSLTTKDGSGPLSASSLAGEAVAAAAAHAELVQKFENKTIGVEGVYQADARRFRPGFEFESDVCRTLLLSAVGSETTTECVVLPQMGPSSSVDVKDWSIPSSRVRAANEIVLQTWRFPIGSAAYVGAVRACDQERAADLRSLLQTMISAGERGIRKRNATSISTSIATAQGNALGDARACIRLILGRKKDEMTLVRSSPFWEPYILRLEKSMCLESAELKAQILETNGDLLRSQMDTKHEPHEEFRLRPAPHVSTPSIPADISTTSVEVDPLLAKRVSSSALDGASPAIAFARWVWTCSPSIRERILDGVRRACETFHARLKDASCASDAPMAPSTIEDAAAVSLDAVHTLRGAGEFLVQLVAPACAVWRSYSASAGVEAWTSVCNTQLGSAVALDPWLRTNNSTGSVLTAERVVAGTTGHGLKSTSMRVTDAQRHIWEERLREWGLLDSRFGRGLVESLRTGDGTRLHLVGMPQQVVCVAYMRGSDTTPSSERAYSDRAREHALVCLTHPRVYGECDVRDRAIVSIWGRARVGTSFGYSTARLDSHESFWAKRAAPMIELGVLVLLAEVVWPEWAATLGLIDWMTFAGVVHLRDYCAAAQEDPPKTVEELLTKYAWWHMVSRPKNLVSEDSPDAKATSESKAQPSSIQKREADAPVGNVEMSTNVQETKTASTSVQPAVVEKRKASAAHAATQVEISVFQYMANIGRIVHSVRESVRRARCGENTSARRLLLAFDRVAAHIVSEKRCSAAAVLACEVARSGTLVPSALTLRSRCAEYMSGVERLILREWPSSDMRGLLDRPHSVRLPSPPELSPTPPSRFRSLHRIATLMAGYAWVLDGPEVWAHAIELVLPSLGEENGMTHPLLPELPRWHEPQNSPDRSHADKWRKGLSSLRSTLSAAADKTTYSHTFAHHSLASEADLLGVHAMWNAWANTGTMQKPVLKPQLARLFGAHIRNDSKPKTTRSRRKKPNASISAAGRRKSRREVAYDDDLMLPSPIPPLFHRQTQDAKSKPPEGSPMSLVTTSTAHPSKCEQNDEGKTLRQWKIFGMPRKRKAEDTSSIESETSKRSRCEE